MSFNNNDDDNNNNNEFADSAIIHSFSGEHYRIILQSINKNLNHEDVELRLQFD